MLVIVLPFFILIMICRRDKTLNYFSIMLKKRLNAEDDAELDGEKSEVKGKKKKKSDLVCRKLNHLCLLFKFCITAYIIKCHY